MTSLWRERAHDSQELLMWNNPTCILALQHCGLLKYAKLELMKGQEDLLRWIIQRWDEHEQVFRIVDHELAIDRDDIYFLTGLSCRGAQANLTWGRPDPRSTLELVQSYYIPESGLVSNKVPIERIRSRSMRSILWLIVWLVGSKSPHIATKAQLFLAVDCVQPQMFNWCETVLHQLKAELTACKTRTQQSFGYGTLIVSFILERVPVMHPRMRLGPFDPRKPR